MLVNGIERRKCPREECVDCISINVRINGHDETIYGVFMNISEGGFSVFTPMTLMEGQIVEFKENLAVSPKKAVVKWNHLYFKKFYKSGMMLAV